MTQKQTFQEFLLSNADSSKLISQKTNKKKRPIATRMNPELVEAIDAIIPYTKFRNRTEFMEHACTQLYEFIEDLINHSEYDIT